MRLELTGHHADITPPLRQLVERRIQKFDRMLNNAAAITNTRLVNTAVLLSDGDANCSSFSGTCADTLAGRTAGVRYALSEARGANSNQIIIHTVYFATAEPCYVFGSTGYRMAGGFDTLVRVASATGGQGFCASNITDLERIFDNLNQQPPFVLVE